MQTQDEVLSFLDFLALDEEIVDSRLKSLMEKSNHSNKHLTSIIQLLLYKNLINQQEDTECENDEEFNFIVKLLKSINSDNVKYTCRIIKLVLNLNKINIVRKSEHMLQQILTNISFHLGNEETLIYLKVCDNILDTIIENEEKVSLIFLEAPLENILDLADDTLRARFLTTTVPRLFVGTTGYNILDRIWNHIKKFEGDKRENTLKILSALSDYFLPVPEHNGVVNVIESNIIFQCEFWNVILFGLQSLDTSVRKISVFLAKKAIDCVMATKKNLNTLSNGQNLFTWDTHNSKYLKSMWDNYFILLDSLEEKQSNIVWPSLKLFERINIGGCWLNCAYNMGLRHDNTQIKLKCMEYRLNTAITNQTDAIAVLEALNDINLYDQRDNAILKHNLSESFKNEQTLYEVIKAISHIKWSPVPYYHLTDVLAKLDCALAQHPWHIDLFKVPCNNINIRTAVYVNLLYFIKNCCQQIHWRDIYNIILLQSDALVKKNYKSNPIITLIKSISVNNDEKQIFYDTMTESYKATDFILAYLSIHEEDIERFTNILNNKISKIQNIVTRQYSEKKECLNEATFLIHLLTETADKRNKVIEYLNDLLARQKATLVHYIQSLLSNDASLNIEEIKALIDHFDVHGDNLNGVILQLYKTCVTCLKDTNDLDRTLLSAFVIKQLLKNQNMIDNYKHEIFDLKTFLDIMSSHLKIKDSHSYGRTKNVLYETSCSILYDLIEDNYKPHHHVLEYMENILECGGYGCLRWILKIMNAIIGPLLKESTIQFDMVNFINRTWNELEELKSNNQYTLCIQEFINLITHDEILEKPMFNNLVMLYCNKILEYGPIRHGTLKYLEEVLHKKITDGKIYGHLIFVLCEVLLYCPISRKDERIVDNVTLDILREQKFRDFEKDINTCFNYEIQNEAVVALTRINDPETLKIVTSFILKRTNETFRNKKRYHGNSQLHKTLLSTIQHLLILLLKAGTNFEETLNWCFDMFVQLPHQTSVRICLEWYISLGFYIQKTVINNRLLETLKSKNVAITSQFFITYWLLKHKIINKTYELEEYDVVMEFLLSHTMGQLFNVRLHAQYLATKLYHMVNTSPKYAYTVDIIEKTFAENTNDKNFLKLKNDYFSNEFDIVSNMSPYFIYYVLPRYCGDSCNEDVDLDFYVHKTKQINTILRDDPYINDFKKECLTYCSSAADFKDIELSKNENNRTLEDIESSETIQKKYVPWKNMGDVNVYDISKKRETTSELIVVATLIDKLPNLGGMARTGEVFGVKTYVVDSLRHLQDKQFQGLSVSAERWINVEEVRPGRPLKEYLIKMKSCGYSVVAAEQTSNSCKLQSFKFPKKTLILLGHEKEGIPCDLLPIMDHCVEIPQQGYVRSLNVHVTAAIFVWEYTRQNVL